MPLPNKKIIFVSDAVYPFNIGGKEKRLHEVSRRLSAKGYNVEILCMKWWQGAEKISRDGVTLKAISPYYALYKNDKRSLRQGILFALNCLKLYREDFDVMEVDHIPHMALFSAKLVCVMKGKPLIAVWHEVWGSEYWRRYLGVLGYVAYIIERMSSYLPDTIISVSAHTTERLRTVLKRTRHIFTISNGVDVKTIKRIKQYDREADIVFAGRLLKHKNVDVMIRAVEVIKKHKNNIKAVIIGNGPEKNALEKLVIDLGLQENIKFKGFIQEQNEVYRMMRSAGVFVLPSTREGFGIAVIEANACGLPVITIDHENNAAKNLITGGENGKICELDELALAEAIEEVLSTRKDPAYYETHAKKYDWSNVVTELERAYLS